MTDQIKDAKPEACEDKECTHKHIVCESLTVKVPGSKATVSIMAGSAGTGIWVQSGQGQECVGLVFQPGVGPYLAIYDEKARGIPMAICGDHIQLHAEDMRAAVTVPFAELVEALKQLKP